MLTYVHKMKDCWKEFQYEDTNNDVSKLSSDLILLAKTKVKI